MKMNQFAVLLCAVVIQVTSAQIMSYGVQRNIAPSPVLTNLGNLGQLANVGSNCGNPNLANIQALNLQSLINGGNNVALNNLQLRNGGNMANLGGIGLASPKSPASLSNLALLTGQVPLVAPNPTFGMQLVADALEIGGQLAVRGKLPFSGTVATGGRLPADGSVTVNYACGRLN